MVTSLNNTLQIQQLSTYVWTATSEHFSKNSTLNVYVNYTKGSENYVKLTYQVFEQSLNRIGTICEKDSNNFIVTKTDLINVTSSPILPVNIPKGSDKFIINIEFIGNSANGTIDLDIRPEGAEY